MFDNSLRPLGREFRCTPRRSEKPAGCQKWQPKSRQATGLRRAAARLGRRALGDGYAIQRDDFRQGIIPMFTPKNKTPRTGEELGAYEATEAGNLNGEGIKPTSKLIAQADAIAASIPFMMTRERKYAAAGEVLDLWHQVLTSGRQGMAV